MTDVRALAERIFWNTCQALNLEMNVLRPAASEVSIRHIESLLREAVENEYKKGIIDSSYSEGLKDAYKRAAEVVKQKAVFLHDSAKATSLVLDRAEKEAFAEYVEEIAAAIERLKEEQ